MIVTQNVALICKMTNEIWKLCIVHAWLADYSDFQICFARLGHKLVMSERYRDNMLTSFSHEDAFHPHVLVGLLTSSWWDDDDADAAADAAAAAAVDDDDDDENIY